MDYARKSLVAATVIALLAASASADPKGMMLERFNAADANSDGVVSHQELMSQVEVKFGEFDKNSDGFIELAELPKEMPMSAMRKRFKQRAEKMAKEHPEKSKEMRKEMEARMKKKHTRINFMAKLDKDGDERISLDEFAMRKVKYFKRGDANGDGNLTLAELESAGSHMKMRYKRMKKSRKMG